MRDFERVLERVEVEVRNAAHLCWQECVVAQCCTLD